MSPPEARVAHPFDDPGQQLEAARLGMWAFLVTEILLFGGLFTGYAHYRSMHPHAFAAGSRLLDVELGGVNTAILIASSFTMALAVHAAQLRQHGRSLVYLSGTILLGAVFLGIKGHEYGHKVREGLLPGARFSPPDGVEPAVELFFSLYFAMTGLHALHIILGIGIVGIVAIRIALGRSRPVNRNALEMTGLYWHFVDVVWIFLFPLLYLVARHE